MKVEFDRANCQIKINGQYAGYIDGSDCFVYEAKENGVDTKITVEEIIKFETPIIRKDGSELRQKSIPIMILRIPEVKTQ
jgi:hypothetical protein